MSMFLGPIHYMMFGKIKTAADRARAVIETFSEKYPAETDEVVKSALPNGPVDFGQKTLDELLGDNPIHQFLQELINEVERAEGALVTALLYRFPDEAEQLLARAFYTHGRQTAENAMANSPISGEPLRVLQQMLAAHYLEGMPCDQVSSYRMKDARTMEVTHSDCLHRPNWEDVGAPAHIMCKMMDQWALGCANAINANIKLERSASILDGAASCACKITV